MIFVVISASFVLRLPHTRCHQQQLGERVHDLLRRRLWNDWSQRLCMLRKQRHLLARRSMSVSHAADPPLSTAISRREMQASQPEES
jgi:hypothetical protein